MQSYIKGLADGIFCSVIPTLGEYNKAQLILTFFEAENPFLQNYYVLFCNVFNQKPATCTEVLRSKILGFVPGFIVLIIREF